MLTAALGKLWDCIIYPIVIIVFSFCSSLDGLLQNCSRKLNLHLIQDSIYGAARAPGIFERLLSSTLTLDKKVKLIQIRNTRFSASSATRETFPTQPLHQHHHYQWASAAHCSVHKQHAYIHFSLPRLAAVQEGSEKAVGSERSVWTQSQPAALAEPHVGQH